VILYFLRHAAAAEAAGGEPDLARALSPGGRADIAAAGPLWRRLNLRPDLIVSSPAVRARQTAELAAAALGIRRPIRVEGELAPGARWPAFARQASAEPDARRVLFVGHEPDLSAVIAQLTGGLPVRMRPAGVACVEFPGVPEPGGGELAWLLDPDLYAAGD
jgi:phosphohistidine phosphatase